ncbi:MAG TPA: MaoC/PaaZ C-terminal domain-containing protein [Baekduia sp.]|uniref:MaoC/PaaZ C-terminal domain-containing protein n=1 Tax=Baekduia sp. TaxID=2600305 RepID=UPI002D78380E|nr:MaoC/PaaZ C-terminal domain-containing protein [Baekduia sp.]HET6505872.1 MaoC/PaaZ C-terminal domain-containing protein [Baekduia sp.]
MTALPAAPVALAAGDAMPPHSVGPLTRTDIVRYAGAGGDLNPIHHDEPLARAAGFPTVFGMGMLHAGVLGMRLARWVGPTHIKTYNVRFVGQVWPGDVLAFTGTVASVADGVATLELVVASSSGGEVLRATATAAVAA